MKIEVLEKSPEKLRLLMSETDVALVNTLRRMILGQVPSFAIASIDFYENNSALTDEYVAHRISMIPLTTDLATYKRPEDCCGGNCSSCSADLELDESGPKTVYSSDFKAKDSDVRPVSGKIQLIELKEGQRLRLEAKAVLGTGGQHAKHQAGLSAYKNLSTLEVSDACDQCGACIEACPKKILKKSGKTIVFTDAKECTACDECVEKCPKGAVTIGHDKSQFVFLVETNGIMDPVTTLKTGVEIAAKKVKTLQKLVSGKEAAEEAEEEKPKKSKLKEKKEALKKKKEKKGDKAEE